MLSRRSRASLGDTNLWDVWGMQNPTEAPAVSSDPAWWDFPGVNPQPGAGSGPGVNWANLANTLTTDFTRVYGAIQPVPAGCTKTRGPNGQEYVSCSGNGIAPQPGVNFGSTAGGGIGMGTLLIGGVIVAALLFMGHK